MNIRRASLFLWVMSLVLGIYEYHHAWKWSEPLFWIGFAVSGLISNLADHLNRYLDRKVARLHAEKNELKRRLG